MELSWSSWLASISELSKAPSEISIFAPMRIHLVYSSVFFNRLKLWRQVQCLINICEPAMMRSLLVSSSLEAWCVPSGYLKCGLHWTHTNFCLDQPQATCVGSGIIQSCTSQLHYQCSAGLSFFFWATYAYYKKLGFWDLLPLDLDLLWRHLRFPRGPV